MGLKINSTNILAWSFVISIQALAIAVLIPVAGKVHQKFFMIFFGAGLSWLLAIVYGIVETIGFALMPMMHTAFKAKKLRIGYPIFLLSFAVILSFDVFTNNFVFTENREEKSQEKVSAQINDEVENLKDMRMLQSALQGEREKFNAEEIDRSNYRKSIRQQIEENESLALEYARKEQHWLNSKYSNRAKALRTELEKSEKHSENGKGELTKKEDAYSRKFSQESERIRAEKRDTDEKILTASALNRVWLKYPGLIFLVLAICLSTITGFVIDKYGLIVYENNGNRARKSWLAIFYDAAAAKLFGAAKSNKASELAKNLVFSDDINDAIEELDDMEKRGDDKIYKSKNIHPRLILADQFKITPQAVQNRLNNLHKNGVDHALA